MKNTKMKIARLERGLTQFDLARMADCTESQISKIETGRIVPNAILRKKLADALRLKSFEVLCHE